MAAGSIRVGVALTSAAGELLPAVFVATTVKS